MKVKIFYLLVFSIWFLNGEKNITIKVDMICETKYHLKSNFIPLYHKLKMQTRFLNKFSCLNYPKATKGWITELSRPGFSIKT